MWVQFCAQPHPQRSREQWGQQDPGDRDIQQNAGTNIKRVAHEVELEVPAIAPARTPKGSHQTETIETKGVYNPKVTMTEYVQEGRQFTHIPNHANQTIWKTGIHAVGENLPCVENPNHVHKGHQPPHVLMHAEANNWTKQTSNRGDSLWMYDGDNVYCMRMCTIHEDIYSSKAPYMTNTQGGGYHPLKCAINQTNSGDGQRGNSHSHPTVTDVSTRDQQEPSTPNTE